jgi:hypothetical protein
LVYGGFVGFVWPELWCACGGFSLGLAVLVAAIASPPRAKAPSTRVPLVLALNVVVVAGLGMVVAAWFHRTLAGLALTGATLAALGVLVAIGRAGRHSGDGGDDDGGGSGGWWRRPPDPPSGGVAIDWDAFEADAFAAYSDDRGVSANASASA